MRVSLLPRVARVGVPPTRPAPPGALFPLLGRKAPGGAERSGGTPLGVTRGDDGPRHFLRSLSPKLPAIARIATHFAKELGSNVSAASPGAEKSLNASSLFFITSANEDHLCL